MQDLYKSFEPAANADKWMFQRTDIDGTIRTVEFTSECWFSALEQFKQFLKANQFFIEDDSIGVNTDIHSIEDSPYWTGGTFSTGEPVVLCHDVGLTD